MAASEDITHLSIGEVLALLRQEFPDLSISKIRFLEGEGLIDPERTPSGYRKFYDLDIVRLRWILRQQRDHFLPLKVIKAKLEHGGEIDFEEIGGIQETLWTSEHDERQATVSGGGGAVGAEGPSGMRVPADAGSSASSPSERNGASGVDRTAGAPAGRNGADRSATDRSATDRSATDRSASGRGSSMETPAWLAELQERPEVRGASRPAGAAREYRSDHAVGVGTRIGVEDLASATGVSIDQVEQMVTYGLVVPVVIGGERTFDTTSADIVAAVRPFLDRGVEPRHLRMFKTAADREAGFYEQMILPLLKQRNPKSREQALASLRELTEAGDELGRKLIRQALRSHLND